MNIKKRMLSSLLGMVLAVTLVFAPILSSGAVTSRAYAEEEQQAEAGDTQKADIVVEGENADKSAAEPSAEKKDAPKETASPAKSADQKAAEKEEEPTPADTKTTYEWKDDQVKVTAVLSDAAAIPDDAKLVVTGIDKNSQHYNYKAYLDALNKGSESVYDESNTLLYDIAFIKDGKEVQPANGTVSVTIDFLASQLSKSLGAEKASDVNIIHLPLTDSVKDKYATTADATKISAGDVKIENIAKTIASGEEIKFVTKTFSVFAYTVDFEYNNYTFSMPGKGTIALSELFAQLHIDKNVADAAAVTFSNPELLTVEKTDGDWTLTSKKAFKSEEKLTVEMKDGEKIEIKVTDAQDALSVDVNLYDYDDQTKTAFPSEFGGDDKIYLVAWVGDSSSIADAPNDTLWKIIDITDGIKGSNSPYSVSVNHFNNTEWGGGDVEYASFSAEQKSKIRVRIIHCSPSDLNQPSLGALKNMAQYEQSKYETIWNGGFDGYAISSAHSSGLVPEAEGQYEVNFVKGNTQEHDVVLQFDPATDKGAIPEGKSYVLLEALSADGNNRYYNVVEVVTDGQKDTVYLPIGDTWSSNQQFSNNWQSITAKVITPKPGKTIQTGGIKPNDNDYTTAYLMGDYLFSYEGRKSETDEINHIQRDEYVYKLRKADYERAITPEEILGEAAEFGIVADTYKQTGHTETNYAVKNLNHNANSDVCGSGTGSLPFYVSNITGPSLDIHKTSCPIDLYLPADQDEKLAQPHINDLKNSIFTEPDEIAGMHKLTEINKTHEEIESYVDGLIAYGKQSSVTMASKSIMAPVLSGNDKTVDTTQFPDRVTIYVDCTNCNEVIATSGWIINKLPNQSIVFNVPGENVKIGEFHVNVYDTEGNKIDESGSTTDATDDGTSPKNRKVDEIIFDHISFNAYEAKTLDLNNASALFLAPEAETVTQSNGAGWILAKGTVDSGAEWHFYRHKRNYRAKGDFTLRAEKKLRQGETEVALDDKQFTFALYELNPDGTVPENPIETKTTDASGVVDFISLKFNEADIGEQGATKTFKYVIKEIIPPDDEKIEGVSYTAEDIYIEVDATNPTTEGSETGEITFKIFTVKDSVRTPITGQVVDDETTYGVGEMINAYSKEEKGSLQITKNVRINGEETSGTEADGTYSFTIRKKDAPADADPVATATITIENGVSNTATVENLEAGTYVITENVPDGMAVDANNKEVTVVAGATAQAATVSFTNNKTEVGCLKITKSVTVNGAATTGTLADGNYVFTISGPDEYTSTQTLKVENGKAAEVTVENLIPGEYTITEEDPTNGTRLVGGNDIKIQVDADNESDIPTAAFVNNKDVGALEITKNVTVNDQETTGTEADGTYSFTIRKKDAPADADPVATATITIENGVSNTATVENLEAGTYVITENVPDGMAVDANNKEVTVVAGATAQAATVSFTNNKTAVGCLKITKGVTVNSEATTGNLADGTYSFTITGPNDYSSKQTLRIENGQAAETVVTGLIPGEYTVTEEAPTNGTSLVGENSIKVQVTANNESEIPTADFVNNKDVGALEITKSVTVNGKETSGTEADGEYAFTIRKKDAPEDAEAAATATITIKDGQAYTATIENLDAGAYIVTEAVPDEMEVDENNKEVIVEAGKTAEIATVAFTNNKTMLGGLTVKKTVSGAPDSAKDKEFKFTVQVKDGNEYVQEDGSLGETAYEFTVKDGEEIKIENIPVGSYVVTENTEEAKIEDYALVATGGGDVEVENGQEASCELTNTYTQDKGSLAVTKNVSGAPKTAKDKAFKFTVQVKDGSDYVQKDGTLAAKAYEFTVKGGETVKIDNIPVGDYVVTENTKDAAIKGYALKATGGGNVAITKNGNAANKLTNTYTEEKEETKGTSASSKGAKTGDDGGIWWFILAAFSLQAMLMWAGMEAKRKARARK